MSPESRWVLAADDYYNARLSSEEIRRLQSVIAQNKEGAVRHRVKLAQHYIAIDEPRQVITYLRPVTEKLNTSGLRLLAKAYGQNKELLQQIRVLKFLVSQKSSDYVSHTRLGEAYFAAEKYDESIESFAKAIKTNKRYRRAYDGLMKALRHKNRRYDLKETLNEMLIIFGKTPSLLSETCKVYYEDGFLAEAFKICKLAIRRAPRNAENHVHLGLTYEAQGNEKRALSIVTRAAKGFKNSEPAQYYAGKLNETRGNNITANEYYKRGAQADNQAFRSWLGWARTGMELQKYSESLAAFRRACQLDRSKTVQEFRSAASRINISGKNMAWASKFNAAALKCRYR